MGKRLPSKKRLEDLLGLARTYRNWNQRELAAEMERDPHNLVPSSGVPRLDLVLRLAEALEWTPQDVIDELCRELPVPLEQAPAEPSYRALDKRAFELHQLARYSELVTAARQMHLVASSGSERANARLREYLGWEGLGRYSVALAAVQEGLREVEVEGGIALTLQSNLAHCHYALGHLPEASALATCQIAAMQSAGPCLGAYYEGNLGFLHQVRGNCSRVLAGSTRSDRTAHIRAGLGDLSTAQALLLRAADRDEVPIFRGVAKLCEGALLELRALEGTLAPARALEIVLEELGNAIDPVTPGDCALLEAYGWWCVFGCNIALRGELSLEASERAMAILTNKADEVAGHLGSWLLRERVWTLELQRREYVAARGSTEASPTIDAEDARVIIGTMARFPAFRATGWEIIRGSALTKDQP
jgi:hypothetical protein